MLAPAFDFPVSVPLLAVVTVWEEGNLELRNVWGVSSVNELLLLMMEETKWKEEAVGGEVWEELASEFCEEEECGKVAAAGAQLELPEA